MTAPPREQCTDSRGHFWRAVDSTRGQCARCGQIEAFAAPAPSADQDQNGGQGHEASVHCSLGALPLESRNAREATCLNTGPSARIGADTQQGQLGANAGSIPAPPTSTPAAQPAEPVLPCAIDGCKQPSLMPASEYCSLHSAIGTSPTGGEFAPQPAEPTATDAPDLSMPNAWPGLARDDWGGYATAVEFAAAMPNDAADTIIALRATVERQAREIADAWRITTHWRERAERAEADRDALHECVRAADAMRRGEDCPMCDSGKLRNPAKLHWDYCAFGNYDAARAKVKL